MEHIDFIIQYITLKDSHLIRSQEQCVVASGKAARMQVPSIIVITTLLLKRYVDIIYSLFIAY